jgi:hypothetical protein
MFVVNLSMIKFSFYDLATFNTLIITELLTDSKCAIRASVASIICVYLFFFV